MSLRLLKEYRISFLHTYTIEPQNGSRYDVRFGRDINGYYFLAWMHRNGSGGSCFKWSGSYVHTSYLQEKLGRPVGSDDVDALCAFIAHMGLDAQVVPKYEDRSEWIIRREVSSIKPNTQ